MYEKIFDAELVAGELVDNVRAGTKAPLQDCIETTKLLLETLLSHSSDETLSAVHRALDTFSPDLENCFDARLLTALGRSLGQWFDEKSELSYSLSQEDDSHIEDMGIFAEIAAKTDPRIPERVAAEDNFDFVLKLKALYVMDQSYKVRIGAIRLLNNLTAIIPAVRRCLVDTELPSVLAPLISDQRTSAEERKMAVELLDQWAATGEPLPLVHLPFLNANFFKALISLHEDRSALKLLINLYASSPAETQELAMQALSDSKNGNLANHLLEYTNTTPTAASFFLLSRLLSLPEEQVNDLFYHNDLSVAATISSRELLNSVDDKVQDYCLQTLEALAKLGVRDYCMREALEGYHSF
ncbi:unnamed protein product, partial [Mesorhabditis spiculigera]